jgi:hypothetical protein
MKTPNDNKEVQEGEGKPRRGGRKLRRALHVRSALASLYRSVERGEVAPAKARLLASIAAQLLRAIESVERADEVEESIRALEEKLDRAQRGAADA